MTLHVEFIDHGRRPQCKPNPAYPEGVDVDASRGLPSCWVKLPKVETTGLFVVSCDVCDRRDALTAAGRPDDPRSYRMACRQ